MHSPLPSISYLPAVCHCSFQGRRNAAVGTEQADPYLSLVSGLSSPGTLGLFSCFNLVAWVLVFLFVEETRRISLEDLDFIYSVPKSKFWRYQLYEYLPWVLKKNLVWIWGLSPVAVDDTADAESVSKHWHRIAKPQLYKPPDYPDDPDDEQFHGSASDLELQSLDWDQDRISTIGRA